VIRGRRDRLVLEEVSRLMEAWCDVVIVDGVKWLRAEREEEWKIGKASRHK
jgi:hypothetical protein